MKNLFFLFLLSPVFCGPSFGLTFYDDPDPNKEVLEYKSTKGEGMTQKRRFDELENYMQGFSAKYLIFEKNFGDLKSESNSGIKELTSRIDKIEQERLSVIDSKLAELSTSSTSTLTEELNKIKNDTIKKLQEEMVEKNKEIGGLKLDIDYLKAEIRNLKESLPNQKVPN